MPLLKNPRHEKFAQVVATGQSAMSAYTKVYKAKGRSAGNAASRLMENVSVQERIREIQKKAEAVAVLTIEEKRAFLREVVMTPISQVDENSRLCQSHKVGASGEEYKMPCKLRALELDAKLAGELTERTEVTVDGKLATAVELQERIQAVSPLLQRRSKKERPSEA